MAYYAIYLRKSRKDMELEANGELETLARHEKQLKELASKLKLPISDIYKEVVSGESISTRPEMQKLLSEVEKGTYAGVLVMEVERLARGDTIDQGIVAQAFRVSNTKIITPIKTYDPSNEFDEEYFEFGLFMSRREYKTINRRIQRGRIASAKEGKFLGSDAPYGYDKVKIPNDKGYTLQPNSAADVVKLIYHLYTEENLGMTMIANKLDEMKIKPRYRDTWSRSTINDILQNIVYTGKIRWSYKKENKQVVDGVMKKHRHKSDEYILVDGIHPAIITTDVFEKAQQIRTGRVHVSVTSKLPLQNPLTGLIYCKRCGTLMTRLAPCSKNPYAAIKCTNRNCDNVSSPLYLVEQKILTSLSQLLEQYKLDLSAATVETTDESLKLSVLENALEKLNSELSTVHDQINNTFDLLEQGVYSVEVFTTRNQMLSTKEKELSSAADKLVADIDTLKMIQDGKNNIIPTIEHILDSYNSLPDAESKNLLLKKVLTKIEYEKSTRNTRGKRDNDNFDIYLYPHFPSV